MDGKLEQIKKILKIQNGDVFEHQKIFTSTHKKIVKLQQLQQKNNELK